MVPKRSQLSFFLLSGLAILIILTYLLWPKYNQGRQGIQTAFSADTANFEIVMKGCMAESADKAILNYGISGLGNRKEMIIQDIKGCVSPSEQDLQKKYSLIKKQDMELQFDTGNETIIMDLAYPIEISDNENSYTLRGLQQKIYRETLIYFDDVEGTEEFYSKDNLFAVSLDENTGMEDINGYETDYFKIKIVDKSEFSGHGLLGNIAYELSPIGSEFSRPIGLRISEKIIGTQGDLLTANAILDCEVVVAWYDYRNEGWGKIAAHKTDGFYVPDEEITHSTVYGLKCDDKSGNGITDAFFDSSGNIYSAEDSGMPVFTSEKTGRARSYDIFDKIYAYIGEKYSSELTYQLGIYPYCDKFIGDSFDCMTGSIGDGPCGRSGIFCHEDISGKDDQNLNVLLRHELIHNIQHINDPDAANCPRGIMTEWGAETESKSGYYQFYYYPEDSPEEVTLASAEEITGLIKANCPEQDITEISLCKEGAKELWKKCTKVCIKLKNWKYGPICGS